MTDRVTGLMGLCARAGKVLSGGQNVDTAIRHAAACLVVLDEGASPRTKKDVADACAYYGVSLCTLPAGMLGTSIGKPGRMVAAITDQALAKRLQDMIPTTENLGGACSE